MFLRYDKMYTNNHNANVGCGDAMVKTIKNIRIVTTGIKESWNDSDHADEIIKITLTTKHILTSTEYQQLKMKRDGHIQNKVTW